MDNLKLFVETLNQLGFEANGSKFDETYFDTRFSYSCQSLDAGNQEPLNLVSIISSSKLHLSVCHGISIILRPFEQKVNWADMSESQVKSLAQDYFNTLSELHRRSSSFMKAI